MDHAEFDALVDRHLDGGLDLNGQDRLEALLRSELTLRERYWQLARTHAQLTWVAKERSFDQPADEAVSAERALRDSSAEVRLAPRPTTSGKRIPTTPGTWRRLTGTLVAATVVIGAGLAYLTGQFQSAPAATDEAVIADLDQAIFAHGSVRVGQAVGNQTLRLERGLAQVRFASGATVILQGPATFTPRGTRGGQLTRGRVSARVPEAASGFTIEADGVRVIDLGTEFGLSVGQTGDAKGDVTVFEGMVQVTATTAAVPFPQVLHPGEAVRVDPQGSLKPIPYNEAAFTRAMPAELTSNLLDRGLIAWWKMEETDGSVLRDSSGRGHDAQVRRATVDQISVPGRVGNAVQFTKLSYGEVANHPDFALMQMTLQAWVKPEANQRIDAQIISKQGSYGLALPRNDAMKFYFWHMDRVVEPKEPFAAGRWVHLCATFDGAIRRFYRDGLRIASITSPTPPKTDDPVRIGALEGTVGDVQRYFQGAIDELRIYNRALSEEEVRLLYLSARPAPQSSTSTGSNP